MECNPVTPQTQWRVQKKEIEEIANEWEDRINNLKEGSVCSNFMNLNFQKNCAILLLNWSKSWIAKNKSWIQIDLMSFCFFVI